MEGLPASVPPGPRTRGRPRLRTRFEERLDGAICADSARWDAQAIAIPRSSGRRVRVREERLNGFALERKKHMSSGRPRPRQPPRRELQPRAPGGAPRRPRSERPRQRSAPRWRRLFGWGWLRCGAPAEPGPVTKVSRLCDGHFRSTCCVGIVNAMPRRHRDTAAGTFHVYTHCVWASKSLFRDDIDRLAFKRELARATAKSGWTCIGYCLIRHPLPPTRRSRRRRSARCDACPQLPLCVPVQHSSCDEGSRVRCAVRLTAHSQREGAASGIATSCEIRWKRASVQHRRSGNGVVTPRRSGSPKQRNSSIRPACSRPSAGRRSTTHGSGFAGSSRRREEDVSGPGPGRVPPGFGTVEISRTFRIDGPFSVFGSAGGDSPGEVAARRARDASRRERGHPASAAGLRGGRRARRARAGAAAGARGRPARGDRRPPPRARPLDDRARNALGLPKGTVGHHVKVLEKAGLIQVVRTRRCARLPRSSTGEPRASSSSRAPTTQTPKTSGTSRRLPSVAPPRRCSPSATTTRRPSPSCARASPPEATRGASSAGSTSSPTTSSPPTTPRASRTASRAPSTGRTRCVGCAARPAALWSHQDFLKLWTGQSISEFGSQISGLAIPWLAAVTPCDPVRVLAPRRRRLPAVHPLRAARRRLGRPPAPAADPDRRRPGRAALLVSIPIGGAGGSEI